MSSVGSSPTSDTYETGQVLIAGVPDFFSGPTLVCNQSRKRDNKTKTDTLFTRVIRNGLYKKKYLTSHALHV